MDLRKQKRKDYNKLSKKGREESKDEGIPSLEDLTNQDKNNALRKDDEGKETSDSEEASESKNETVKVKQEPAEFDNVKKAREDEAFKRMIGSTPIGRKEFVIFYGKQLKAEGTSEQGIQNALQRFVDFMAHHDKAGTPGPKNLKSALKTPPRTAKKDLMEELTSSKKLFKKHLAIVKELERKLYTEGKEK